jgi:predicted ribosomally synthesized peptide with nif11-like leader
MTENQLRAFLKACSEDPGLRDRVSQAKTVDEAVSIAKAAGFSIEPSELLNISHELTDNDLENVAGGQADPFGETFTCTMSQNPCQVIDGPVVF